MKREGGAKDPVEEGARRRWRVPPFSAQHTGQMEDGRLLLQEDTKIYYNNKSYCVLSIQHVIEFELQDKTFQL